MAPQQVQWGTITLILDNEAFRKGFLAARAWYFQDIYMLGIFLSSYRKYEHDLKRHTEHGWRLVSCTGAGRDIFLRMWFTAI